MRRGRWCCICPRRRMPCWNVPCSAICPTITGLTLQGAGQGIKLTKCHDVLIERCTFAQMTRGLVAEGVEGLRVESCVFSRCTIRAFLHGSVNARLAHNTVAASTATGVILLGCGGHGATRSSPRITPITWRIPSPRRHGAAIITSFAGRPSLGQCALRLQYLRMVRRVSAISATACTCYPPSQRGRRRPAYRRGKSPGVGDCPA